MLKYVIRVSSRYEHLRPMIEDIIHHGMPDNAEIIYRGRNTLYRVMMDKVAAIVKDFRKPNFINSYIYTTVRTSKAKRSYLNAKRMQALGFLTPAPIAYGEVRKGSRLIRSYYISRELTGATEMRQWETHPHIDIILPAFAREIYRLHQAGVYHRDFSPGNVLYTGTPEEGYKFHYVDLNRMRFGVKRRSTLMSMFRSINLDPAETARLARLYAEVAHEDPDTIEREALAQLEGYFRERRRKQFFKRLVGK